MTDHTPDIAIYGSPVSPFVRKVAATCIEKGVDFAIEAVDVFNPPEWFLEISPMKRIPVMRDRSIAAEGPDGTIADSSAIVAYLERKYLEPALFPADAYQLGRAVMLEEYADTSLALPGGMHLFRPLFFNALQGKEPDVETARDTWKNKLPTVFDYLEKTLGDGEFLAGDALSIADITTTCVTMQISLVAHTPFDNWPNFSAYFDRMRARPSIAGPFAKADSLIRKALPERFDLT